MILQNIKDTLCEKSKYSSIICVLINILQRGCLTLPCKYLSEYMGKILIEQLNNNEIPSWINLIKGDKLNNYYLARDFFY